MNDLWIKINPMDKAIQVKSFEFAVKIVKATRELANKQNEYVLSKQLLRSGTAIVALLNEAQYAESKRDFLHKMTIALKECKETEAWLKLLSAAELFHEPILMRDNAELLKMLIAITKTTKNKLSS
jgi:four helix bundle protein